MYDFQGSFKDSSQGSTIIGEGASGEELFGPMSTSFTPVPVRRRGHQSDHFETFTSLEVRNGEYHPLGRHEVMLSLLVIEGVFPRQECVRFIQKRVNRGEAVHPYWIDVEGEYFLWGPVMFELSLQALIFVA